CKDKTPDFEDHQWPVVRAECEFRASACQKECQKDAKSMNDCYAKCSDTYDCDKGKMPPSHLRVKDVSAVPDY
ncbi:hypothetical protein SYNPS1DRAFT_9391, partial [Syncephalis pseudoplumigaleata]